VRLVGTPIHGIWIPVLTALVKVVPLRDIVLAHELPLRLREMMVAEDGFSMVVLIVLRLA
jgi:hypothetical protein